jgi:hypothetical protein
LRAFLGAAQGQPSDFPFEKVRLTFDAVAENPRVNQEVRFAYSEDGRFC